MNPIALCYDVTNQWICVGLFSDRIHTQINISSPRGASDSLASLIRQVLDSTGIERPDWICTTCGPGSFTGIRIGVSMARNLAQLWEIPVLGLGSPAFYFHHARRADSRQEIGTGIELEKGKNKRLGIMIDGKQKKAYTIVADRDISANDLLKVPVRDLAPEIFLSETGSETAIFADKPEALSKYIKSVENKVTMNEINISSMMRPLGIPQAAHLYELSLELGGMNRAGHWSNLKPEYLRLDPATSKFPQGIVSQ